MSELIKVDTTSIICATLIALATIFGYGYYSITDRGLMAQNIDSAISKGVDPLSVRCSYAKSDDIICVAYAASTQPYQSKK